MDKVYHIYAKGKCLYHNLSEGDFKITWEMLDKMVDLIGGRDLSKGDLSYECLTKDRKEYLNASY